MSSTGTRVLLEPIGVCTNQSDWQLCCGCFLKHCFVFGVFHSATRIATKCGNAPVAKGAKSELVYMCTDDTATDHSSSHLVSGAGHPDARIGKWTNPAVHSVCQWCHCRTDSRYINTCSLTLPKELISRQIVTVPGQCTHVTTAEPCHLATWPNVASILLQLSLVK